MPLVCSKKIKTSVEIKTQADATLVNEQTQNRVAHKCKIFLYVWIKLAIQDKKEKEIN